MIVELGPATREEAELGENNLYFKVEGKCQAHGSRIFDKVTWVSVDRRVPIYTVASDRCETLEEARENMKATKASIGEGGDQSWLFFQKMLHEYEDIEMKVAQVWANVAILKGIWTYENGVLRRV